MNLRSRNVRSAEADPVWEGSVSLVIANVECDDREEVGVSFGLYGRSLRTKDRQPVAVPSFVSY